MVRPEAPPPAEELFADGSNLLVRAPVAALPTAVRGADGRDRADGFVTAAPGGLGETVEFETDLFVGRMRVVFRVPPAQQDAYAAGLLAGKRRRMWVMVQGRLKRPVPLDDLLYGSFFARQLRFPAPIVVAPALHWLARRFAGNALTLSLRGESPCVAGPVVCAAQTLNVARPGEEPDLVAAPEDTRLLFGPAAQRGAALLLLFIMGLRWGRGERGTVVCLLRAHRIHNNTNTRTLSRRQTQTGEPLSPARRRAYFRREAHRAGKLWLPEHVITLHTFDHSFDYHTMRMSVPPGLHIDMVK